MKLGLDQHSLEHLRHHKGVRLLEAVDALDLDGLQYLDLHELSPTLDPAELQECRAYAENRNLFLNVGVPSFNPYAPDPSLLAAGDGDLAAGLQRHLELIAEVAVGSRAMRCALGGPGDRRRAGAGWAAQVARSVELVEQLAPVLRALDLRLAFENHADISTWEAIEIVDRLGTDIAGICFDTGNATFTMENHLAAAKRVAPFAIATHLKDEIFVFGDDGFVISTRPAGQGVVPIADVLLELHRHNPDIEVCIEDYPWVFPVPIFDHDYVASFSELGAGEFAELIQTARRAEQSIAEGTLASPPAMALHPWSNVADARLRESAQFVRGVFEEFDLGS